MMEKQVNQLIEESCLASSRGEFQMVSRPYQMTMLIHLVVQIHVNNLVVFIQLSS